MKTRVGYTGGSSLDPTYRNMGDHTETVALDFDQEKITYEDLLKLFWKWHNPCTQHCNQYMSAIFYHGTKQKLLAEQSRDKLQKEMARPIATKILPAETFYNAENYHQKYILRQHHTVLDSLDLSDEDLITSTVAGKLNGYLGGYGTMEQFEIVSKSTVACKLNSYLGGYGTV
ncbi:hypothetical protein FSP39_019101 [Pinctada imbricata]|uniref:peptide-methionine (S)-S-oxide reductase n=1 Tax=Pinctada imbricata TaxID=66713 RepID=A0AA89BL08_PINIB|nr:hypothetical protein FSP39_019101 [Pinctada imbricata]